MGYIVIEDIKTINICKNASSRTDGIHYQQRGTPYKHKYDVCIRKINSGIKLI